MITTQPARTLATVDMVEKVIGFAEHHLNSHEDRLSVLEDEWDTFKHIDILIRDDYVELATVIAQLRHRILVLESMEAERQLDAMLSLAKAVKS